ncbi:MAG: hypothetical protein ABW146_02210 [Candidatus Sedimenticola sp. 6PFRAG7]
MNKNETTNSGETQDHETDEARREALKKMGRFGAYTAPAMMAMLSSSKTLAQVPSGGPR